MRKYIYVTLSLNPFPRERDLLSLRSKLFSTFNNSQLVARFGFVRIFGGIYGQSDKFDEFVRKKHTFYGQENYFADSSIG